MSKLDFIRTKVQLILRNAEAGHDWEHIQRVCTNATSILVSEKANEEVVMLGCLLHDIADPKFHNGDEEQGPKIALQLLQDAGYSTEIQKEVESIVRGISFKNSFETKNTPSIEFQIVQDADRLDAIGAIGIARTFHYGGFKNRSIFNPDIPPIIYASKEAYKNSEAPTINHFYEKLLLLKDSMNTFTAKKIANKRHQTMCVFLEAFFEEVKQSPFQLPKHLA